MQPSPLPAHASVVVIGGGIMGCSTLYHLAKMGVSDATLLERNRLTSGTTWHSAGQVRALRSSRNLTRMIRYSVDLYSKLEKETGQSVGWIQKGSISIATNPERFVHIKRQEALAHAYGLEARSISPMEAQERWPLMNSDDVIGAVWSPDDGRVSPSDVCAALVKGARANGARIFENTRVTGVLTGNGKVKGLETSRGTIKCDSVAVCAGLWSREVGAMAGAEVPVMACEHFYLLTEPIREIVGNLPTLSDHDHHLYIRDDSGGLLVGCFEPFGKPIAPEILSENFEFSLLPEDWDHFEPMMENALNRIPALHTAGVKMLLNGPESFTPDGMFMLGETAGTRGFFLGCGMNSIGVASGGGAGMNLAHRIVHGRTCYDLSDADAMRFDPVFNSVEHLTDRVPEILGTHYEISYPGRQLKTARKLRELPLAKDHAKARAHFGQFNGWERPLYYNKAEEPELTFGKPVWFDQVEAEVRAAHEHAALFDASPLGKIEVNGPEACAFLQYCCVANMDRPPGRAVYTAVLNESGTYENDLTAHRIDRDHYRLFVGAASIKRDLAWFNRYATNFEVALVDSTEEFAVLSLMGPRTDGIMLELGAPELIALDYFEIGRAAIADKPVRAARISYVGEAGWEITTKAENARTVYAALNDSEAVPAGLYAQTSMRIEKGFAAMGHELDSDVTPIECGLGSRISQNKEFIGSAELAERRKFATRSLVTLIFHDKYATPLGLEPIYFGGRTIGHTTSASYGHRIGGPVALAHVNSPNPDGLEVEVDIAGNRTSARTQFAPAFDPSGARMKRKP